MDVVDAKWKVDRLLKTYPQATKVLIELRTFCVGCSMSGFCTLEDVCRFHHLPLEELFAHLESILPSFEERS